MKYFKNTEKGYIYAIGKGGGQTEITESEYNEIMSVIANRPTPSEGKSYRLKTDLTWEEYDLPVPSEDDEIPDEEAFAIITGKSV